MNPKPLKMSIFSKRPKGTMTIGAGFICKDGIIVCADREESAGASKKVVQKLITIHADPWNMTVATAGSAPAGDLAVKRLQEAFMLEYATSFAASKLDPYSLYGMEKNHEQLIINVLTKLHEDHIWNNPKTDHAIKLIIGISFIKLGRQYLYLTEDNIPQPINSYCCMGYGEDLCTYFAERLYHRELSVEETMLMASFIFREVNASVQFCGKGTDMAWLRPNGLAIHMHPQAIEAIQKKIPEFSQVVKGFWDTMKSMPEWFTSISEVIKKEGR
jgi:20S proteasome alpha/beta subunit